MGWFRRNEHDHEQLSVYLDGELDPREAEILEGHLATCDACAALLEDLRGTRAMLSALPAQLPRRSFVLGAEYARPPQRDATARRLSFVLAPAAALSVFVALLFVDLAGNSSSSSDESAALTASSRQADDSSAGAGSAGSVGAPQAPEAAASTFDADAAKSDGEQPDAPPSANGADAPAAAAGAAQIEAATGSSGPQGSPAAGEAAITAAEDEAPAEAPEPLAFDAPDDDDDEGISTLRILQVLAAAAFLASGFYVFVWPRVSRGGS